MSVFFGDFALDQERRQLLRSGEPVSLEPKAYEVLILLVERRPRVLSRAQIRDVVWPGVFISESTLNQAVNNIRRALDDDAREPRFLRTAHGFGYAFCGVAHEDDQPSTGALARAPAEKRPYPGLSAFTESEAEQFFGREAEVASLWEKVRGQKLLALIGPSGVGKTSFVRAGVIAHQPEGWATVYMTPGANPVGVLARELTPKLASVPLALADLVQGATELVQGGDTARVLSAVLRWRLGAKEALLVIDQFEELFALNAEETQARLAMLLGRLTEEAGVHVLLSLRDDFLFRCHSFPALSPVFDHVTPLGPPSSEALRRALVEPAARHGVRFEDDALVDEMVGAVAKERGALPLLAFAASRLWDERDRESKLLTRAAYDRIGGVAGALVQHAEATLTDVGAEREGVVRELFRNLVTAEGTRAEREREELLSVFAAAPEKRDEAEAVLDVLVGSRLLTEYDGPEEREGQGRQRIEIVHESLLTRWPRLVKWRAQDEEGAVLRDQLRQAARLWSDKGRPQELLWTGESFREYVTWRGRYAGSLSALEEDFARAMRHLAERRRRRRRAAGAALLGVVTAVAIVTSVLWKRADDARRKAEVETQKREAGELLALGRVLLDQYPSGALAHAIASLERADNEAARRFAVEALWRGPTASVLHDAVTPMQACWSPDGRWLAVVGPSGLAVIDGDSGKRHALATAEELVVGFSRDSTRLVSQVRDATFHLWSLPEVQLLDTWNSAGTTLAMLLDRRLLTFHPDTRAPDRLRPLVIRERSIDDGKERALGVFSPSSSTGDAKPDGDWLTSVDVDPNGEWLTSLQRGRVLRQPLAALGAPPRLLGRHDGGTLVAMRPWADRFVTVDGQGEVRLWNPVEGRVERTLEYPAHVRPSVALDPAGRFLAVSPAGILPPRSFFLFDLLAPRLADPTPLVQKAMGWLNGMTFHPNGRWLASTHGGTLFLWNLAGRRSTVLHSQEGNGITLAFAPDGRLVSGSFEGLLRVWDLTAGQEGRMRELQKGSLVGNRVEVDRGGRFAVISRIFEGRVATVPLDGSPAREYTIKRDRGQPLAMGTLDPSGQQMAVSYQEWGNPAAGSIRILDLGTGQERVLRVEDKSGACLEKLASLGPADNPLWLPDGRLVSDGLTGLRAWDLTTGASRQLRPCRPANNGDVRESIRATPDARTLVTLISPSSGSGGASDLTVFDFATGTTREITSHGTRLLAFALDPTGTLLITGDADGLVRCGPLDGGTPHLLYGHTGAVTSVAVSPDGKKVASGANDETIRLWLMPEGPPLHTLPYEPLLAKLRSLTNLRVVPDAAATTGYELEAGPFPGWAKAPEW